MQTWQKPHIRATTCRLIRRYNHPAHIMQNSTALTPLVPVIDTLGTSFYNNDHVAIIGANVVIGLLGILGNSVVILVYLINPKMTRTLTSLFIFHQSFIDMVSSFVFLSIRLDIWRPLLSGGVANLACRLWYSEYLLWVIVMTSTLNLLLVSLERYISIAHFRDSSESFYSQEG